MEAEGRQTQYRPHHVFAHEPCRDRETRGRKNGIARLWIHHLYSQIRRCTSGRTDRSQTLREPDDAESGYVLDRNRWYHRRRSQRRRQPPRRGIATSAVLLFVVISIGCHSRSYWQARYSEAEQNLRNGNSERSISIAKEGFSALRKRDPVLAWKFRVLNAHGLSRQHKPEQVLALLASTPDSLPSDLRAAANIIRSYSLCELRREAEASALLDNTERLAIPSTRLTSELQYTRASCVFSEDRSRAEGDLQKAATLVHGIDGYLEARAIIFRG